ncbi:MAG: haloacid dehalogenase [Desulfobacterales bacterium]|jgi:5'(3')-deoxyribonucleotidase
MIDPASVAFDIDGVFADTMTLFLDIAHQEFDVDGIRYTDITCYNLTDCLAIEPKIIDAIVTRILDGTHTAPLKPIAGAPEVLNRLGRLYGPVIFVTARPYLGPLYNWIHRTLALEPASVEVISTGSHEGKTNILLDRNISYFIDDRLETCFALQDAGVRPILFEQPWNREPHPFVEVGSWNELQALIEF